MSPGDSDAACRDSGFSCTVVQTNPLTAVDVVRDVLAEDFDGDGRVDVGVATEDGLLWARATAPEVFEPFVPLEGLPVLPEARCQWSLGHLNDDGRPDFVIVSAAPAPIRVALSTPGGYAVEEISPSGGDLPGHVAVGDVRNSGTPAFVRVVTQSGGMTDRVEIWERIGAVWTAVESQSLSFISGAPGLGCQAARIADFDSDGTDDFLYVGLGVQWLFRDTSEFQSVDGCFCSGGSTSLFCVRALGDFDGDSRLDSVCCVPPGSCSVSVQSSSRTFSGIALASGAPILSTDIDQDDDDDLLWVDVGNDTRFLLGGHTPLIDSIDACLDIAGSSFALDLGLSSPPHIVSVRKTADEMGMELDVAQCELF